MRGTATLAGARKPELVEDAMVSWPVLFIYPASMQTDAVEAFHELHTFADHLDVMFGSEACPTPQPNALILSYSHPT